MEMFTAYDVRTRLLEQAREHHQVYDHLLRRFVAERLLHRMGASPQRDDLVLRGGWALACRLGVQHRRLPTVELTSLNDAGEDEWVAYVRSIAGATSDGVRLDPASVRGKRLGDDPAQTRIRIRAFAYLAKAQVPFELVVQPGDVVTPEPSCEPMGVLLDFDPPDLAVAHYETVVAEALHELVVRGRLRSRMTDLYDAWLAMQVDPLASLSDAIRATFGARGTTIPREVPEVLTDRYADSDHGLEQWDYFLAGGDPSTALFVEDVVEQVRDRAMPAFEGALGPR